MQRIINCNKLS